MIYETIRTIIAEHLGINESKISLDTSINEDLEIDSLDAVEIIMAIEDAFSIEVDEEAIEQFTTVREMVEYVEAHQ
ncbi:acyl carrier protein [Acetoanaerobium noterae]|jgi:acyl carrier protein|uniref:Acyl carrier protein n=1 Tax=Acetoanaerobium noterae TaxID=745369 RepID=A0A1T5A315_9FIRM|nr:acyl carrier protein [Acetoanaerobium noterae]MBP8763008.1 acyl carrier protein [Acetoanaerobium sp.]MDK2803017.1 acyl carrier protein [Peptostreptococcaceae bacterium]MBP9499496.1 acyl carrier protein [Acetoanaerobium sp.]MBP9562485.1 acyl carrier protein [Acetoanaerobium sp.]SKB29391.1 acyl carrier protein [Acetoanaerobium noterae]